MASDQPRFMVTPEQVAKYDFLKGALTPEQIRFSLDGLVATTRAVIKHGDDVYEILP
jgi:hypothetical protein